MDWTLELVVVPVTDVDRARDFYAGKVGFVVDHDTVQGDRRIVQLTPPGSGCSIAFGTGLTPAEPGTLKGMQLVVADIAAAHAQLVERGVEVSGINQIDPRDGGTLCSFDDPDGNSWIVQEIRARAKSPQ